MKRRVLGKEAVPFSEEHRYPSGSVNAETAVRLERKRILWRSRYFIWRVACRGSCTLHPHLRKCREQFTPPLLNDGHCFLLHLSVDRTLSKGAIMAALVQSSMYFLDRDPLYETEKLYELKYDPVGSIPRTNMKLSKWDDVEIRDIRGKKDSVSFQTDGFCLMNMSSAMAHEDFDDIQKVEAVYLQEVGEALKKTLSAKRVQIFDFTVSRQQLMAVFIC